MTSQWREDRAAAAATYGWTVLAALVVIAEHVSIGMPIPRWVLASISTVLVLFGLLLGGAIYVRWKRGRWWTTGTVAGVTFAGVASLLVGHLVRKFSGGNVSDGVVAATGAVLLGVGLWQVAATAEWPAPAIRRRQHAVAALAAALGLGVAAVTGVLAAVARWLFFLWATGIGWWLAPAIIVVGVTVARRVDLFRAAAVAVATVGAVVVAVAAPAMGIQVSTSAACVDAQWTTPIFSVVWTYSVDGAPGVGWTDGCNSITSTVAPDVAVLGLGLLAIGLLGVAVGTRGVPRRDELPDGA